MLQIKNLTLYLKRDLRTLIEDFSFSPGPDNQKIALIGEEGNGKSSLLKTIYNPDLVRSYLEIKGEIQKADEVIGYLPQQMPPELSAIPAAKLLHREIPWDYFDFSRYYKLAAKLALDPQVIEENRALAELSGGEKIKFFLLKELMKEPTLLLLDEPSNDLDLESLIMLERFISECDIPVIFVSHDERLLARCSDTVIHFEQLIHKSRAVHSIASLNYEDYVRRRDAAIEKQTQMAKQERDAYEKKMRRYRELYNKVNSHLNKVSRQDPSAGKNLKDKMRQVKSQGRRYEREKEEMTQKPVTEDPIDISFDEDIYLDNKREVLSLRLPELRAGSNVLSRNVKLDIRGPEKICIIGRNGCGKTTLLKRAAPELRKNNINYACMPQNYDDKLDLKRSPVEFLTRDHSKAEHTRIRSCLGSLNFTPEEMLRPVKSLSGGQKAKLYFAAMIFSRAEFLLLDEPSRNLSPLSGPEIRQALTDYSGGILCVSHDRALIEAVFDKVLELREDGLHYVNLKEIE